MLQGSVFPPLIQMEERIEDLMRMLKKTRLEAAHLTKACVRKLAHLDNTKVTQPKPTYIKIMLKFSTKYFTAAICACLHRRIGGWPTHRPVCPRLLLLFAYCFVVFLYFLFYFCCFLSFCLHVVFLIRSSGVDFTSSSWSRSLIETLWVFTASASFWWLLVFLRENLDKFVLIRIFFSFCNPVLKGPCH